MTDQTADHDGHTINLPQPPDPADVIRSFIEDTLHGDPDWATDFLGALAAAGLRVVPDDRPGHARLLLDAIGDDLDVLQGAGVFVDDSGGGDDLEAVCSRIAGAVVVVLNDTERTPPAAPVPDDDTRREDVANLIALLRGGWWDDTECEYVCDLLAAAYLGGTERPVSHSSPDGAGAAQDAHTHLGGTERPEGAE